MNNQNVDLNIKVQAIDVNDAYFSKVTVICRRLYT